MSFHHTIASMDVMDFSFEFIVYIFSKDIKKVIVSIIDGDLSNYFELFYEVCC